MGAESLPLSMTSVVESPNEVGIVKKEVCSDARNNRSAAISAPGAGAICNFLLPTSYFLLPTSYFLLPIDVPRGSVN